MKVRDVMRKTVVSLPHNATLKEVVRKFVQNHVDSLPIVDAALRVVGLITIDELIHVFMPRYNELLRDFGALEDKGQLRTLFDSSFAGLDRATDSLILADDIMNTRVQWVLSDDSLLLAASRLRSQHCHRLPVVDRDQKLVGLISDFEIILTLLNGKPVVKN